MIFTFSFSETGNKEDINSFDKSATFNYSVSARDESNVTLGILMAGPLLKSSVNKKNYILGGAATLLLTEVTKRSFDRKRPYTYNPDVPEEMKNIPDSRKSFYSGHTAMAFYSAAVMSKNSPAWIGMINYALAYRTGYLRYKAGMHFPSDILVGALVGYTIGKFTKSEKSLSLTPLGLSFSFWF